MSRARVRFVWMSAVLAAELSLGSAALGETAPDGPQVFVFHHDNVLGTQLDLTIIGRSRDGAQVAERAVLVEIERLRRILSAYDAVGEVYKLNATPVGEAMKVSPELIEVLKQYDGWSSKTQGAYSGHVGELVELWKRAEKSGAPPTEAELAQMAKKLSAPAWEIDETAGTVKRISDQRINVDSVGKGYIIGKAMEAATRDTPAITGLIVNLGGDLRTWGMPKIGQRWSIGVQDPSRPGLNAYPLTTISVPPDRAVASSGAYQRFYTIAGKRYSHLFDARTGQPTRTQAATVVAPDNATANALASICCILRPGEAIELVNSLDDIECMIVTADGSRMRSSGFKQLEGGGATTSKDPKDTKPATGAPWPSGFEVNIDLETVQTRHKPYVFVWVVDSTGKHVKTLGAWGNEMKYVKEMREWWKLAQNDRSLQSVTHATQRAGKYPVTWDGKDQKGKAVPTGTYTLWIEVAAEKGPHVAKSVQIVCDTKESTATLAASAAFKDVAIRYGAGGKN